MTKPRKLTTVWYTREVCRLRRQLREDTAAERAAKAKRKATEGDLEFTLLGLEHAMKGPR